MKSRTTREFWAGFDGLPRDVQRSAVRAYVLWRADPRHPSLHFKRIHGTLPVWSVRVGIHWRTIGRMDGDTITWFWIGSHTDYDRLIG